MDMDKFGKLMKAQRPGPLPEFDGIRYPPAPIIVEKGAEKALQDILYFQSRESDVMICTSPKSGTHWIFEISNMLLRNKTELDTICKGSTMIEFVPDFTVLDKLESPRLLNCHCLFKYLPKKHIENGCKIIHMIRNPKDVCVSLYHQYTTHPFADFTGSWDDYFEIWMSGKCFYGSWYNYEKGMETVEKLYPDMILTCHYEKMKKDSNPWRVPVILMRFPIYGKYDVISFQIYGRLFKLVALSKANDKDTKREIKRLADFLGIQCTEPTIKDIADTTFFQNMQQHKRDHRGSIYRKGEIGDWKNHFTVEQNERFDKQYTDRFKDSTYTQTFE